MKIAAPIFALAATLAFAQPASAKVNWTEGSKLCKAQIAKQAPTAKSITADRRKSYAGETYLVLTFIIRGADDSSSRMVCEVDRKTEALKITAG